MLDQGQRDEARRLVDEALPLARTADAHDMRLNATRAVIGNLARLDLKAAEALIPAKGDERTINDLRGLIGQSLAAENPAEAERLARPDDLEQLARVHGPGVHPDGFGRPPAHRQLAQTIKLDVLRGYAQGKMAEAVAASHPSEARELLQEAFSSFRQVLDRGFGGGGVWGPSSAAVMAAVFLPVVERVEPDRLGEVDRGSPRFGGSRGRSRTSPRPHPTPAASSRSTRVPRSPPCWFAMTERCPSRSPGPSSSISALRSRTSRTGYLDRYAVFPTLTLADPEGMAELVDALPERPEADLGQSRDIARLIIAGTLAAPESEFWSIIRRAVTDVEILEREEVERRRMSGAARYAFTSRG